MGRMAARLSGYLLILVLLGLWQTASTVGWVNARYVPAPSTILIRLWELTISGQLLAQYAATFGRLIGGYLLAVVIAVPLGILMGYYRWVHDLMSPTVELLRPVPSIALIPPLILLFGLGTPMIVVVVCWGCLFPILINTIDGVRSIDRVLVDTGRTFRLSEGEMLRKLILPAVAPYVETGMRVSLALGLILVVVLEMLAAQDGIGDFLLLMRNSIRPADMFAAVVSLGIVGYLLNAAFLGAGGYILRWHRAMVAKETA
jgi:ABC-type nitrate/sulfonate/bicarbonate transport system permease component